MTNKERLESLPKPLSRDFDLKKVKNVNHRPHVFMVGPRHVKHASDNCCGMLGEATMREIPCSMKNCGLSYAEHKSDRVLFIKVLVKKEIKDLFDLTGYLNTIKDKLTSLNIDGVAFIAP